MEVFAAGMRTWKVRLKGTYPIYLFLVDLTTV